MKLFRSREGVQMPENGAFASQAMVDFAAENWKLNQGLERAVLEMEPMAAERFLNQFEWYQRKVQAMLDEAGLSIVDLTGMEYSAGMAVSPLNLEDFPNRPDAVFRIAQMVDPIIMQNGQVRKTGTVMLSEEI
ncbi:MAG: hypothetical protein IJT77_00065 [Clostridia bacterium]|nr:hypothetical protein [Clostridia bacterium]